MSIAYLVRRIVSLILLFIGIISFIAGLMLLLYSTNILYKIEAFIPALLVRKLHTISSFTVSGAAVIHIYLNWKSIKSYLKM